MLKAIFELSRTRLSNQPSLDGILFAGIPSVHLLRPQRFGWFISTRGTSETLPKSMYFTSV